MTSQSNRHARVLLVADDPSMQHTYRRPLSEAGCEVIAAHSLPEAEVALEQGAFDACLLDLQLCKTSGMRLTFTTAHPDTGHGPRAGDAVSVQALERAHIESIVAKSGSLEAAARLLGIDSSTLYRKRKQYERRDSTKA